MKVVRLLIRNLLAISEVEIRPGKITQIVGKNNQGKTSFLKGLEVAVRGSTDGTMVKRGEDEAEILMEMDDATVIRRRIKSDGKQALTVKQGEFSAQKPQSMLDTMFGSGTFNPLGLLDPKTRTQTLLAAIPLPLDEQGLKAVVGECPVPLPPVDYTQHGLKVVEQAHKYLFQRRAEANKDVKAKLDMVKVKESELQPLPDKQRPTDELIRETIEKNRAKIEEENRKQLQVEAQTKAVANAETWVTQSVSKVSQWEREIALLEQKLNDARSNHHSAREEEIKAKKALSAAKEEAAAAGPDQEAIAKYNANIQQLMTELTRNSEIRALEKAHAFVADLKTQATQADIFANKLSAVVERLHKAPAKLLEASQLPVNGLSYADGEFYFDNTKIEHLSTSATIRLALGLARASAGPAQLICLDGAEALDNDTYTILWDAIKDDGFQYFITRVGEAFSGESVVVQMANGAAVQ